MRKKETFLRCKLLSNKRSLKIVRLATIRNEAKQTISTSGGGLGLLQMISEPNIGQYANEDARPHIGWRGSL